MPNLGESRASGDAPTTVKLLLLADTKGGKTHYAMQAAEAGFNVLYLDCDVAIQTLMDKSSGLSDEALGRVTYLNISDYVDEKGNYVPFAAKFFVEFTTTGLFTWNDSKGRVFDKKDYLRQLDESTGALLGGDEVWQIRPSRLDRNTVVILDSWTNLVHSLQQWKAQDLGIDILDVEKMERDMYTGTAHKATQFLHLLRTMPSHLIVIGHPREYRKMSVPVGSSGAVREADMKVEWTRMVPMSTSNPHALTMGKNFSDIAWIDVNSMGKRTIDFKPNNNRVIGGHLDEKGPVDELTFAKLVEKIGGTIPSPGASTDAWLTRFGPGEFEIAGSAKAPLTGSSATTAKPVGGLSGIMGLKPKGVQK